MTYVNTEYSFVRFSSGGDLTMATTTKKDPISRPVILVYLNVDMSLVFLWIKKTNLKTKIVIL